MRTSEDLSRITPIIWHELETLGVPFIRCGVFIVDEKKVRVRIFLTTPEGKPLGALNIAVDATVHTKNVVEHWRRKEVYTEHWDREDFISWMDSMIQLGQIRTKEQYMGTTAPPVSLNLHFIPFKQGMLYVGDAEPLPEEKIAVVKSLAETFAIAYARYEDFVNLEQAKDSIEKALRDLKATQSQLIHSEKMASLGELTAGIAHEIQNLDEARAIADDIKINEEKINLHGKRADAIVKGMLQHSRSSGSEKVETDINALADEYLRLAYHGLRAKDKSFNADFRLEADESLPMVRVIPQEIGRVILNLINNAFYAVSEKVKQNIDGYKPTVVVITKFIKPPPGRMGVKSPSEHALRTREDLGVKGEVEVRVQDNGNGIPEEIKEKIFQPFFTTKPTGEGTGLGLSLSYDIVKLHGGTLKVQSVSGQETIFIITLPI